MSIIKVSKLSLISSISIAIIGTAAYPVTAATPESFVLSNGTEHEEFSRDLMLNSEEFYLGVMNKVSQGYSLFAIKGPNGYVSKNAILNSNLEPPQALDILETDINSDDIVYFRNAVEYINGEFIFETEVIIPKVETIY